MTSQEQMRQRMNEVLGQIRNLIDHQSWRMAYRELQRIKPEIDAQRENLIDLVQLHRELSKELKETTSSVIQSSKDGLKKLINLSLEAFDSDRAQELLTQWEDCQLDETEIDPEFISWRDSIRIRRDEASAYRVSSVTQNLLEAKWAEIEEIKRTRRDVAPNEIAELYNTALTIARDAAAQNPTNSYLAALHDRAQRLREEAGKVEGIATSGAESGAYKRVLASYKKYKDDDLIPVYDIEGNFISNLPKQEARERTLIDARAYAQGKIAEYRDVAAPLRREDKPREALSALQRYKENELDEFLEPNDIERIHQLENELFEEIRTLEVAESKAEEAAKVAETDGLQAWKTLTAAMDTHRGLRHSQRVQDIRADIILRLNQELKAHYEDLSLTFQNGDWHTVTRKGKHLKDTYSNIDDQLAAGLRLINVLINDADSSIKLHDEVTRVFSQVKILLDNHDRSSAEEAQDLINGLQSKYDRSRLEIFEDYESLVSRIQQQLNANTELERLGKYESHTDPAAVERAINNARAGAQHVDDDGMAQRYTEVAQILELHLEFLRAQRDYSSKQLDDALSRLTQKVLIDERAPDTKVAEDLLSKITKELELKKDIANQLLSARDFLENGRYPEALGIIRDLIVGSLTRDERAQVEGVRSEIARQWRIQIEQKFMRLTVHDEVNRKEIEDDLDDLKTNLDLDRESDKWRSRLAPILMVAQAREEESVSNYEQAERFWTDALRLPGIRADARQYIETQLNRLNSITVTNELNAILTRIATAEDRDIPHLVGQLSDLATKLGEYEQKWRDVGYSILQLQAVIVQATLTEDPNKRARLFSHASNISRRPQLTREVGDEALEHLRIRQIQLADLGPRIAEWMGDIELRLAADKTLDEIQNAVSIWKENLSQYSHDFASLDIWYRKRKERVVAKLVAEVPNTVGVRIEQLSPLAKLLILEQPQGKVLEQEIGKLSANLDKQIEEALGSYKTAAAYQSIESPKDIINKQIKEFEDLVNNLNIIAKILSQFNITSTAELQAIAQNVQQRQKQDVDNLEQTIKSLTQLRNDYESVVRRSGEGFQQVEEARKLLETMKEKFPEHPATIKAFREIDGVSNRLGDLKKKLDSLRDYMKQERFVEANQIIASIDVKALRSYKLHDNLNIEDVYQHRTLNTWEEVVGTAQKRLQALETIQAWAAPFAPDINFDLYTCKPRPQNDATQADEESQAKWVVEWDAIHAEVETLIEQGHFSAAINRIQEALDGVKGRFMGLNKAIEQIQNPPLVDVPPDLAYITNAIDRNGRYIQAIRYAGTNCGRKILQDIQVNCVGLYQQQSKEAEDKIKEIRVLVDRWNQYESQYTAALKRIAGVLGPKKGNAKSATEIRQGVNQASSVLKKMREMSPDHVLLPAMSDHYILSQARQHMKN